MARLPSIGISDAVTPQVRSSVSGADVARASPFAIASRGFQSLGQAAVEIGDEYERGVELGVTADALNEAQTSALRMSEAAKGDPELFREAWRQWADQRLATVPERYRASIGARFVDIGGTAERGIMVQTRDRDRALASDRIDARRETLLTEMTDLARGDQSESDEFRTRLQEYNDLTVEKVSNPFFAYSQERANLDLNKMEDAVVGARVSGILERIYATQGYTAAQKRAQEIYANDEDGMPKVAKLKAIKAGLASLKSLYEADSQARRQFGVDAGQVVAAINEGALDPFDPLVDEMIGQAGMLGDPVRAMSLQQARQKAALVLPMQSMSLPEQLDFLQNGVAVPVGGAADILRREEGFREGAYFDVNAFRAGYGSDTITRADGTIEAVTKDTIITREDAERDLARRIGEFTGVAAAEVGQDAWNGLPQNVRSALVSVTYNYGNLPNSVAAAAKIGDPEAIAAAVETLDANPERRSREAAIIRGSGGALDGYVKGVLPAVRTEIGKGLAAAIASAGDMLDHDRPLDQTEIADLIDAARIVDEEKTYTQVGEIIARSSAVGAQVGLPVGGAQAMIDSLRAPGPRGEEALRLAALDQAQATFARSRKLLDEDPRGYGIERGMFAPGAVIDFANIADAPAILASRVPEMERLAASERTGPLSVLRPGEASALKAAWDTGDANTRVGLLGALAQSLPGPTLMATLSQFADKADTQTLAVAGGLYGTNQEAGAAVVRGIEALKVNPRFAYSNDNAGDNVTRSEIFPSTALSPNMEAAWQAHVEAARAVYADMSARAGDASGKFDEERFRQAVGMVTGGLVKFNGQTVFAPVPNMDQSRFDEIMAALPEWALGGAVTPDGTPVTMDFVRRMGRLQGYGDGRYVIGLGDTGAYAMSARRGEGVGGPFVLDLRPFRDGVFRQSTPGAEARYRAMLEERGVGGADLEEMMRVYRDPIAARDAAMSDYQRAVGAGNAAPPPLSP